MPQEAALGQRICSLWPSPAAGRRRLPARGSGLRVTHGSLRGEGQELARPQEAEGCQPRAVDDAVEAPCQSRHVPHRTGGQRMQTFLVTIDFAYTAVDDDGHAYGRTGAVDLVEQSASPRAAEAQARAALAASSQGAMIQVRILSKNLHNCKPCQRCACPFLPPSITS